jgi:hypothetical protein
MIFGYTQEVKDACRRLEAVMEEFERTTSKHRLADIRLHKNCARMRHEFEVMVDRLRRM